MANINHLKKSFKIPKKTFSVVIILATLSSCRLLLLQARYTVNRPKKHLAVRNSASPSPIYANAGSFSNRL